MTTIPRNPISRRHFLQSAASGAAVALAASQWKASLASDLPSRPNIIFILTDDGIAVAG